MVGDDVLMADHDVQTPARDGDRPASPPTTLREPAA